MCPVWTPLNPPPRPSEVWDLSDDARIILQALREAHRQKQEARLQLQAPPDPRAYYRSIYRESFKQETPHLSPKLSHPGENATQTSSNSFLDLDPRIKAEPSSPQDSPVPHMLYSEQGQLFMSSKFNSGMSQKNTWSRDCHRSPVLFGEEYLRTSRPDARIRETASETSVRPTSPRKGQAGKDSWSPPIDTRYYREANESHQGLPSSNFASSSNEQDIELSVATKSEETQGMLEGSSKDRFLEKASWKRPRYSVGNDKDRADVVLEEFQLGTVNLGKFPSGTDWSLGKKECSTASRLGAVAPQLPLTEVEEAWTSPAVRCKPDHKSIPAQRRNLSSDMKTEFQSPHGYVRNQNATAQASTLQKKSTASTKLLTCCRKAGQPTIVEMFGDSNSAVHGTGDLIRNVTGMTSAARDKVSDQLAGVSQVSMCIEYKDGSSQLREPDSTPRKRKAIGCSDGAAEYLLLAYESLAADDGGGILNSNKKLEFVSISLCGKPESSAQEWSKNTLLNLMGNQTVKKVCFDAQEMIHILICSFNLDHAAVSSDWLVMDPKVAAWLLDADHPPITFSDLLGRYLPDQASQSNTTKKSSICKDLTLLGTTMKQLFHLLSKVNLWQLYLDMEMKLCPILAVMEVQGIRVQSQTLREYGNLLQNKSQQVEAEAHKAAGCSFQIASHAQLRQILFEKLGLDKQYQGRKLARTNVLNLKSTSETVLLKLQDLNPLPKLVLQYRQLAKLKSTYIDGILECIEDGYVHTSWEQTSTASGRLQSSNPNIQNIPKQPVLLDNLNQDSTEILARKPFVSRKGWTFIAADFQSIELRLLAHLSHDPVLLCVFNKQDCTDIFVELTTQWLGVSTSNVTSTEREKTKRMVYSVIYGVGPDKLAETLGVSREEAKTFTKSFLSTFPGVSSFTRICISCCRRHGFVQTVFRRRRLIPNINSAEFHIRSHAERQCVNFVVQGSAADICKLAMIRVVHALASRPHLKARLVVQIHDELLLEVADLDVEEVKGIVKSAMEMTEFHCGAHVQLQVPLPVSVTVGKNWGQLQ